ncbi:ATP-binding cassette domain-containing protein [Mycoplasma sp. Mirounga ES2805-ORL]|uniref:ATP-binding cassette domain-containing protein n=1 Tax=Mycoplasma sp. Mirounga ES2805-ORL TaxID=754514 RepID=UPI00197C775B|nr:ATP-binding cassette domain-containing protein [Mycoplasma sp. Mirounga ES2805-ORL]
MLAKLQNKKILKNVSFNILKHRFHVFIGKNGSGKSTTLNIITNNYIKWTGEFLFKEKNLKIILIKVFSFFKTKFNYPVHLNVINYLVK